MHAKHWPSQIRPESDRAARGKRAGPPVRCVRPTAGDPQRQRPETAQRRSPDWASRRGIRWDFTQPGHPEQNAYIERFNGTYRREVLDAYQFETIATARRVSKAWRKVYNERRAHSAIGYLPPMAFKQRWGSNVSLHLWLAAPEGCGHRHQARDKPGGRCSPCSRR